MLYWWSLFVAGALLLIFGPAGTTRILGRETTRLGLSLGAIWRAQLAAFERHESPRPRIGVARSQISLTSSYLITDPTLTPRRCLPFLGRRIGLIAKKELLKVPILGYGMGYVNIMAIDRTNRERAIKTMEAAADRLRSGISFGVFAEGTRAKPGEFLPFKKGAFYMAVQAGVPIVPVAIKNTDSLMGKGTGVARTGTIEMVLLPPVETTGIAADSDVQGLVERVQQAIAKELGVTKLAKR